MARAGFMGWAGISGSGLFEDVARIAERGLFDLIFFGDSTGIPNTWEGNIDAAVRRGVASAGHESVDHRDVTADHLTARGRLDLTAAFMSAMTVARNSSKFQKACRPRAGRKARRHSRRRRRRLLSNWHFIAISGRRR